MKFRPVCALVLALLWFATLATAETLSPQEVPELFKNLRKEHPRLLFTHEDQIRIQKLAEQNEFLKRIIDRLETGAETMLAKPNVEYKLVGPRLLGESRQCVSTVLTCAMAYRLTGDKRFAERAKAEMLTAAAFQDWHPPHFLDVAEMTTAVAVGYDWLYDYLTPDERATLRNAIVHFGLDPAKKFYPDKGWAVADYNWNQVCNGGMTLGALAIAEDEPALSREIVSDAVRSIPLAMASYKPDGLWAEGPAYWDYATTFNALFIGALQSALGTDGGFPTMPGFDKTADFHIETTGPAGLSFNYADAGGAKPSPSPVLFWLARTFHHPLAAAFQRSLLEPGLKAKSPNISDRFFAMNIAWFADMNDAGEGPLPIDASFHGGTELVAMRSAWNDPDAIFVGFKGGDNSVNHGHLDIGTFVLDANGRRWAVELGSDNYDLPGYFDKKNDGSPRWKIFRTNTRSQNTLLIADRNQPMKATSDVISFRSRPDECRAVVDMTSAYAGQVSKALRGIALLDRSRVLVQDDLENVISHSEVRWGMVTPATVDLEGAKAVLTLNGAMLNAEILEPAGSKFELVSTNPGDPKQNQNAGTAMLAIRIPTGEKANMRIAVLLTPMGEHWPARPRPILTSLAAW